SASWNTTAFNDSAWTPGATGIGFQTSTTGALPSEAEPNNSTAAANSAAANFSSFSGNLYHQGINGNAGDDYFKIGLLDAGDILTATGSNRYPQTAGFDP